MLLFFIVFIVSSNRFYNDIRITKAVSFTEHIYELQSFLSGLEGQILVGDWGITNQLILLHNDSSNLSEIAFAANTTDETEFSPELQKQLDMCEYLVLRKQSVAIFKNADTNLRSVIDGKLVYTDPVFEVYTCKTN